MARGKPQFWLKFNNGAEVMWLPVNPDTIAVASVHGYEDIEVSNLGEYTIIGNGRQKEFTLSSLFPRDYNASFCEHPRLLDPWEYVKTIERWQRSGKPVRYIVTNTPINIAVTIRNFEYEERGGEPGDIYYTLDLKEYTFIKVAKKGDPNANSSAAAPKATTSAQRPSTRVVPTSYTVKSGDSLFKISATVYGKGNDWRKIYDANKKAIGANPNVIRPGLKLVIP
ncbi:LysM peptidoglycan-binding domain-containing protein (plasmid) [Paenibacillus sp. JNUCC32]|uniref:LysM peptidoglycan-binding domain-containing protein n=1 Tax=Paenibacillus sp. JNUCC32 TaxID=2777984 RepID=UPI001788046B|nr:LysM peptidoglycan-binding domain-containing protein [Paenibacillus sp. JNUCC-32]QOT13737.1 LysM peptidoglycan-binding domain-containing protein [Paenibacillus sp. JNUCC-32]